MQIHTPVYLIKAPKERPQSTNFRRTERMFNTFICTLIYEKQQRTKQPYVCVRALFYVWTHFNKNRPRNQNEGPRIGAKWAKFENRKEEIEHSWKLNQIIKIQFVSKIAFVFVSFSLSFPDSEFNISSCYTFFACDFDCWLILLIFLNFLCFSWLTKEVQILCDRKKCIIQIRCFSYDFVFLYLSLARH